MFDFVALALECAPTVAHQTMAAVVNVESGYNPYAIGVVGGRLARQPRNIDEAVATAESLERSGYNFSVGIAQVNRYNLPKYKLDYRSAFEPCANLRAGSKILEDCYTRASGKVSGSQSALQAAISCYYSGNFTRGFKPDEPGKPSYVQKVFAAAGIQPPAIPVVPAIQRSVTPNRRETAARPSYDSTAENSPILLRNAARPTGREIAGDADSRATQSPTTGERSAGERREATAQPTAANPAIVF